MAQVDVLNDADATTPQVLIEWEKWLRSRLDPGWRPSEWNAADLLFTGDPANPATRINACSVRDCRKPITGSRWCTACDRAARQSDLPPDEFSATYRPAQIRQHRSFDDCEVDGCARHSQSRGLCAAHYQRWFRYCPEPADLDAWLSTQTPYAALDECPVFGCHMERRSSAGLCITHHTRWNTEVRRRQAAGKLLSADADQAGLADWVKRQVPLFDATMFSLAPLSEVVRLEVLHVLQLRDVQGKTVPPINIRAAVRKLTGLSSIALDRANFPDYDKIADVGCASILRQIHWNIAASFDEFRGVDPTRKLVWDLRVIGQSIPSLAPVADRTRQKGEIDFGEIRQEWLRELAMHFGRVTSPSSSQLRNIHRAAVIASNGLELLPGGGHDPGALGYSQMTAVVEAFNVAKRLDGTDYKSMQRNALCNRFFELLEFGRLDGVLNALSQKFTRHKGHRVKVLEDNEDEIGKALPDTVFHQLDDHLHLLGDLTYGSLPKEAVKAMFRTVYILLRDTGRRPVEIGAISAQCLEFDAGEYQLIWDNRKGRRLRRRLPIPAETAEALKAWLKVRSTLALPESSSEFLFPGRTARKKHLETGDLWLFLRNWFLSIPVLESDEMGEDGQFLPFDRTRIFPYAFRHSFCQRYADAGVPMHVLQDLMDHRSPQTTASYYKISNKMKRAAMDKMRLHTTDRHGEPAPMGSANSYMVGSVAVHYGNCIEPSNVKAGGHACPIRFQCSGCPSFRPDPSHLPAIEDHVRTLKTNKEMAEAMGAADYTITGMAGEIGDYQKVIMKMRDKMEGMSDEERAEVEEASRVLRRLRASSTSPSPVALPMPVVPRRAGGVA
ncbi:tyrosine-type recombinase/integrase [Streptomyces griseobrunneus]